MPETVTRLLDFVGQFEQHRRAVDALYRRTAESATARSAATDLLTGHPQRAVMVMGDLNDAVEAATIQILNGKADTQRLWNLAPRTPAAQPFSRIYRGHLADPLAQITSTSSRVEQVGKSAQHM